MGEANRDTVGLAEMMVVVDSRKKVHACIRLLGAMLY